MENLIRYKKIEPESFLRQTSSLRKKCLIAGFVVGITATSIFGYNFFNTNKYIDKDFSKERIEKINSSKQSEEFSLNIIYSVGIHNPIAKSGRDLAYSLREEDMNERERVLEERGIRIAQILEKLKKEGKIKPNKK